MGEGGVGGGDGLGGVGGVGRAAGEPATGGRALGSAGRAGGGLRCGADQEEDILAAALVGAVGLARQGCGAWRAAGADD